MKVAFEADGSRIAFSQELMTELSKRILGSITRMNKIQRLSNTKPDGEAHKLIKKSDRSLLLAMNLLDEEVSEKKLHRRPAIKFLRSQIVRALNIIDSIEDGIAEGGFKVKTLLRDSLEVKECLSTAFNQLKAFLVEEKEINDLTEKEEKKAASLSDDGEIKEGREVSAANVRFEHNLQKAIQTLHLSQSNKPTSKEGKPFHILDIPVIPILNVMMDPKELESKGIGIAGAVGSYVALSHQMVIAVDLTQLNLPVAKSKKKKWTPSAYVNEVAAVLSQQKGHNIFLVTNDPAHRSQNDKFLYYWLVTEDYWNRFHRAIVKSESGKSKGLKVESWGIPF
jgi:hypothetical protein